MPGPSSFPPTGPLPARRRRRRRWRSAFWIDRTRRSAPSSSFGLRDTPRPTSPNRLAGTSVKSNVSYRSSRLHCLNRGLTMKSLLSLARSTSAHERVDRDVQLFEDEWRQNGEASLDRYWEQCRTRNGGDPETDRYLLAALIKADLRCRYERGDSPPAAEYLARFEDLRAAKSRAVSLIYEEFCLLEEKGRAPEIESFCDRYPLWKDSLASQLRYHCLFSQAAGSRPPAPTYPMVGEYFEEFRLEGLIGTGGSSRVFLATDLSLGGKRVVLKVSLDKGEEPKTQGALDHPHIVPVNSVVFQPENGLRGLSMPFRPGLPLDEIVKRVRPATRPKSTMVLWEALVRANSAGKPLVPVEERASYLRNGPSGD